MWTRKCAHGRILHGPALAMRPIVYCYRSGTGLSRVSIIHSCPLLIHPLWQNAFPIYASSCDGLYIEFASTWTRESLIKYFIIRAISMPDFWAWRNLVWPIFHSRNKKKLALFSDIFRSSREKNLNHTCVTRSNCCSCHDWETVFRPFPRDLSFTVLQWASGRERREGGRIRGSLFSVLTSFHCDSNSSSFCCRTGGRGRARISAKIGECASGDASLDPFFFKKKRRRDFQRNKYTLIL